MFRNVLYLNDRRFSWSYLKPYSYNENSLIMKRTFLYKKTFLDSTSNRNNVISTSTSSGINIFGFLSKRHTTVLLFSSAYNGMTQNIERLLLRRGYKVYFREVSSQTAMQDAFSKYQPNLIICPTLMTKIPKNIYETVKCLIVHPGIVGDRGPSSLDWAILNKYDKWGVTIVEADDEMDAGDIWASGEFKMPTNKTKTQIYNENVIGMATDLVLNCVEKFHNSQFKPTPLNYGDSNVKGFLHEHIKQSHPMRMIDWNKDSKETILKKIKAGDSQPGVKAELTLGNEKFLKFIYDAREATIIRNDYTDSRPGEILAKTEESLLIATRDGAISVGQIRATKNDMNMPSFKLPATLHFEDFYIPETTEHILDNVSFQNKGDYGILKFNFYNGAMNKSHCNKLKKVLNEVISDRNLRALIIQNGPSNGIHLNVIENSITPSTTAYNNLLAINKVVRSVICATNLLTVSAMQASAGAGGVYLALASDFVFGRSGIVLNPHYKRMGLYGSEYHTYLGEKRVGKSKFRFLKDHAFSLSIVDATEIGLLNNINEYEKEGNFNEKIENFVQKFIDSEKKWKLFMERKCEHRFLDEKLKPLNVYEQEELEEMREDIFHNRHNFHEKRRLFVYKGKLDTCKIPSRHIRALESC